MGKPLWRKAFDAVERPVGGRLERAVQTDAFASTVGVLLHAQAGVARRVERASRRAWHRVNLPAATDVVLLREHVLALERSVRRLEQAMAAPSGGSPGAADREPRAARRRPQPGAGPQRDPVRRRDR